ncbi:ABC1 kinase family protein [Bacillus mycoides]|uniref:Ubiquinone biosynthesis protein n=1 Tax=Bacillus mycoides TaxID=1405 RepID=A0A3D9TN45_BACMY|nr:MULTISPECIES: AarF/UbiB family protein [Bacillus]RBP18054.1 ubiquinone biosynthesis protein [Bacillus sp. DB-2]REF18377.1 ubiquinone biosynthesis protein [Bacillus mycoides]
MFFQLFLLAIIMSFISGRLIGTKLNFFKQASAATLGVSITSAMYWFLYLRYQDESIVGVDRYFWLGSSLIVSMLCYLVFELFDPIKRSEMDDVVMESRNPISKFFSKIGRQKRYMRVSSIAIKHGMGKYLALKRSPEADRKLATSLRNTLEECGGVFIKFGQVLSTRSDLLPPVFIHELSNLQENVTRLSQKQVEEILIKELHIPKDEIFSSFEMEPLAAASIGQVHKAKLKENDQDVVVKLLRPNISETIKRDLDILIHFALWISNKSTWAKNIGFLDLAHGFSIALKEEIDFKIEARNFEQVSDSLKHSETKVKIPKVYQEYSNSKILVLEFLDGVSVKSGSALLNELQIDTKKVQRQLFDCILEQIFFKGIFHADPHPGNVYILRDGTPALLDFGSVGRLGTLQQDAFKRLLIGFERKNSYVLLDGLLQLVEKKPNVDKEGLEQSISQLLIQSTYVSTNGSEEFIQGLFQIISEFELAFYPMVAGAFRSLITLEGTMLQLNPEFNLMDEAKRFAEDHAASFMPVNNYSSLKEAATNELLSMLPAIRRIPRKLDDLSSKLENGELSVKVGFFSDETNASFITTFISQFLIAFIGTAFGGISVGVLHLANNAKEPNNQFLSVVGYGGLFISAILLVRVAIHAVRKFK